VEDSAEAPDEPSDSDDSQSDAADQTQSDVAEEPADESDGEDEFSVEAQLARLLGKSKGAARQFCEPAPSEVKPAAPAKPAAEHKAKTAPAAHALVDRSHLNEGPKHRQNKSAVREEVQSFRAVAQMSVQTALAKHSWNTLRNQIFFKTGITAASAGATIWFGGTYVTGNARYAWAGIACAMITMVCIYNLFHTLFELKKLKKNKSSKARQKAPTAPNAPAAPAAADEDNP
jgi:hypothetical protein